MSLTVDEAIGHVTHTLASGQEMPTIGELRILNDAGHLLCNAHHWAWLLGKEVKLHLEEDQDHIWLPRNLKEIVGQGMTSGLQSYLTLTTHQELIEFRTRAIVNTQFRYYAALTFAPRYEYATGTITFTGIPADASTITIGDGVHTAVRFEFDTGDDGIVAGRVEVDTSAAAETTSTVADKMQDAILTQLQAGPLELEAVVDATTTTQVNLKARHPGAVPNVTISTSGTTNATVSGMSGGREGGPPEPRLDIWPTPTAASEEAFSLYYRAGWETLEQDTDFVSIPEYVEGLYINMVRAVARGYEREDVRTRDNRLAEIRSGVEFADAVRVDNEMNPDVGHLRGGAIELEASEIADPTWSFGTVSEPT